MLSRSVRGRSTFQKFSNPIHNHHAVKQDSFHHGHDCHWCRRSSRQQRYVLRYEQCGKLNLRLSCQDNSVQNVGNAQAPAEQGYHGFNKRQGFDHPASMKQQDDDEDDDEDDDRFDFMKQQDDDEDDDEDDDRLAAMPQKDAKDDDDLGFAQHQDDSDDEDDDGDDDRLASRKRQDDGEDDAEHPAADQGYVGVADTIKPVFELLQGE